MTPWIFSFRRVEEESNLLVTFHKLSCAHSRNREGEIIASGLEEVGNRSRGVAGRWLEQYSPPPALSTRDFKRKERPNRMWTAEQTSNDL